MHIAFLDISGWEYDASAPYTQPMGGSQSAMCYLAAELAKLGHRVTIYNGNHAPITSLGVDCRPEPAASDLDACDVVIVLNAACGRFLQKSTKTRLVLWNHHAFFQPPIQALQNMAERAAWDAMVFVSHAQLDSYRKGMLAGFDNAQVLHNCVSPAFEDMALVPQAQSPPALFYSSTPFRGLDVLLAAFPAIRAEFPEVQLKVFSSMDVYRDPTTDFDQLYALAKSMPGVTYLGSMGQRQLARELAGTTALVHPSTFPECHSIAALEALAVGAAVITTDLGGQREATGGLAYMIAADGDKPRLAQNFAELTIKALHNMLDYPERAAEERELRWQYIHRNGFLWATRAKQWEELLQS